MGRLTQFLDQTGDAGALVAHPAQRELQAPHGDPEPQPLCRHPQYADVLIEQTPDGPDFIRVCERHQFATIPTPGHPSACPLCVAEYDAGRGRQFYAALQSRRVV